MRVTQMQPNPGPAEVRAASRAVMFSDGGAESRECALSCLPASYSIVSDSGASEMRATQMRMTQMRATRMGVLSCE